MNKKRTLPIMFLALFLTAGVFSAPAGGQGVGAAANNVTWVNITWVTRPPATVCLGDKISLMIVYVVHTGTQTPGGITPMPGGSQSPGRGNLMASSGGYGTITPNKWSLRGTSGSGDPVFSYQATKEGYDEIVFSSDQYYVDGGPSGEFEIVKCDWDIKVAANMSVTNPNTDIDTDFHGDGVVGSDKNGLVMGEGTYHYNLSITYIPTDPDMVCEQLVESNNDSTFIVAGTESPGGGVSFTITFYPVEIKAAFVECFDKEGKIINTQVFPSGTVDPTEQLGGGKYTFNKSALPVSFHFNFGKSQGTIWVFKRTAK